MGSKVRCPACGAKNEASSRRCRMCTVVINADAPDLTAAEPPPDAPPSVDHFDASVIDRQLQSARSKFGDDASGLAARLAAARAAKAATRPTAPVGPDAARPQAGPFATAPPAPPAPSPEAAPAAASSDASFEPVDLSEMQARTARPTAPPIEHEAEPFDPDALFRDMS